jgi:hypothetical protein
MGRPTLLAWRLFPDRGVLGNSRCGRVDDYTSGYPEYLAKTMPCERGSRE